jgi:hypothetical protein
METKICGSLSVGLHVIISPLLCRCLPWNRHSVHYELKEEEEEEEKIMSTGLLYFS